VTVQAPGQAGKSGQLAALIQERIRHIYRRQRRLDQAETRPEMLGRRCPDNQASQSQSRTTAGVTRR
jgi:hypothetical protein